MWNSKVREHGAAVRSLGSLAQSQLLQDFVQLMPEPVQTPLFYLADGFGYLEVSRLAAQPPPCGATAVANRETWNSAV